MKDMKEVPIPSHEEVEKERERLKHKKEYNRVFRSTIYGLLVVAAVAVLLATIYLPVLQVSGTSMEPTLQDGNIVVLVKNHKFKTGDLCGFYWQNKLLIKRVIGNPGDIINIDEDGNVYVNDQLLEEDYVTEKALGETDVTFPYQVPENRYFMLGDHRSISIDSRNSSIGCIEKDQVVGKIVFRLWPFKIYW